MKSFIIPLIILLLSSYTLSAQPEGKRPEYSKAGFFEIPKSGRVVYDFNVGWRFYKGAVQDAERIGYDDSNWDLVNTPHGLELISTQSSGSNNYQGEAWYRKHFTVPDSICDKRLVVNFEAVMGKCKVWLNGELLATHVGGYLPFSVDLSDKIKKRTENVIAVWADNSDDPSFPPGKSQKQLDYSYFGGMYRDVWLVASNKVYVTDANQVNKVAGGGVFVHYEDLSEESVKVVIQTDIANDYSSNKEIEAQYILRNADGTIESKNKAKARVQANSTEQINCTIKVNKPRLWSPSDPNLYHLEILVVEKGNKMLDGVRQKIGIRKIEFRGKDGLYLNNKPYPGKLVGANRHQDFAYLGNALPNSGQWRDAQLLKDAGCDVVRAAHYPADPAFMDACDALGLFFIVATPGWQFWNDKDATFEKFVYQDIRNMVRRDRNRPSVLLWEPILNETWYPDYFAEKVHHIVHEEYPFKGAYTVCDVQARGQEFFDVVYSHPFKGNFWDNPIANTSANQAKISFEYDKEKRSVFTREWGDCVDDWNAQNSPSRAARNWGEQAQLVQANHYAKPPFVYTSWEALYNTPSQHVGGALWNAFDYQRGYHPEPFYGGIMDVFRQPKYSYYLFKSQRSIKEAGPMIYIAHEMTPFSPSDVTVFTNCDAVRLIVYGKDTLVIQQDRVGDRMPGPVVVFKNVFHFADLKNLNRDNNLDHANITAEGLVDGEVLVRTKKMAALRPSQIKLELLNNNIPLVANGSDMVTVVASITDRNGTVKHLSNDLIQFKIRGEGSIVGNSEIMANPLKVEWGTAPILVRSSTTPGQITISATILDEGTHSPTYGEITFTSVPSTIPALFNENQDRLIVSPINHSSDHRLEIDADQSLKRRILELEKELNGFKLKEVEKQQEEFEGNK